MNIWHDLKLLRLKQYNITPQEYMDMMAKQGNKCAICNQFETKRTGKGNTQPLSIDHNHRTNKVRALLCNNCNRALGIVENGHTAAEAAVILRNMTGYLIKHEK